MRTATQQTFSPLGPGGPLNPGSPAGPYNKKPVKRTAVKEIWLFDEIYIIIK